MAIDADLIVRNVDRVGLLNERDDLDGGKRRLPAPLVVEGADADKPMRPGFDGTAAAAFFVSRSSDTVEKLARVLCAVCSCWRFASLAWRWTSAASKNARWLVVRLVRGWAGARRGR